jgi:cytochrome P450
MDIELDFFDPAYQADPYPYYERLRRNAPVYYNAKRDVWLLTRYVDVEKAYRTPEIYSSTGQFFFDTPARQGFPYPTFITLDAPRHGPLRSVCMQGLQPRRIAVLETELREYVEVRFRAALEQGRMDFVQDIGYPVTLHLIGTLMAIPPEERQGIWAALDLLTTRQPGQISAEAHNIAGYAALVRYFEHLVERRRRGSTDLLPGECLLDDVIAAERSGLVNHPEAIGTLLLVALAGVEMPARMIALMAHRLWCTPGARERLIEAPQLRPVAIEEALRLDGPTHIDLRRSMQDVELRGQHIPKGALVGLCGASANRDEERFDRHDAFDLYRGITRHLSFGFGIHSCIGAPLSRLQLRTVLDTLLALCPNYAIEIDACELARRPTQRVFTRLPATPSPAMRDTAAAGAMGAR